MAFGGTVMMLTSTFKALSLGLQLVTLGALGPLAKLITGLGGLSAGFSTLALALAGRTLGLGIVAAVGVGLGAALDEMFPNNPLARLGHKLGGFAADLFQDDYDPNAYKNRGAGSQYVGKSGGGVTINPANVYLDSHQVGSVLFNVGGKDANGPQTGTSLFDPTRAVYQAGGLGF
jgi:hypothetical protein